MVNLCHYSLFCPAALRSGGKTNCFPQQVRERAMTLLLEHYYRRGEARGADAPAAAAAGAGFHLDTLPPPPPIFATSEQRGDGRLDTEKSLDWSEQQSRDERTNGIKPLTKKSTK